MSVSGHIRVSVGWYVLSSFVLSIALDCTETQLLNKLSAQVQDYHFRSTNLQGLGPNLIEVFDLAYIGKEADDFIALVQKPAQNGAGIEATCELLVRIARLVSD